MKEKFVKPSLSLSLNSICSDNFLTNQLIDFPDFTQSASETLPPPLTLLWLNDGSETYFELIIEDKTLTFNPLPSLDPDQEGLCRKNSETNALKPNKSSDFPEVTASYFLLEDDLADERRLFTILLYYLEKFSCLDAIEKNIGDMEAATQTRNVNKLKQIARNCWDECVNCEIPEALSALSVLEQVNPYTDPLFAGSLINQVKTAHKNLKAQLIRKLNKIAEERQKILQMKAYAKVD